MDWLFTIDGICPDDTDDDEDLPGDCVWRKVEDWGELDLYGEMPGGECEQ